MASLAAMKLSTILASTMRTSSATVGFDKTFSPDGQIAPGVMRWADRSGGIALGYPYVTLSVRPPNKASRVYRITEKVGVPHLETVAASTATGIIPAAPIAYTDGFIGEFMFSDRGTSAERLALLSLVISTLIATINASDDVPTDSTASPIIAAITNFEPPYG